LQHRTKEVELRVELTNELTLSHPFERVWQTIADPNALAGCVPGLTEFRLRDDSKQYSGLLVERLGPFALRVALVVSEVVIDGEAGIARAAISGDDRGGKAKMHGWVEATCGREPDGTTVRLSAQVEVLGRLAKLGASPIRRRTDEVFREFARNLTAHLG
jgi:carbon monoxide dehydrogenase subunit G